MILRKYGIPNRLLKIFFIFFSCILIVYVVLFLTEKHCALPDDRECDLCIYDTNVTISKVPERIFFVEASGSNVLTHRQACAVESAAKNNQDYSTIVYMTLNETAVQGSTLMLSLRNKYKTQFIELDVESLFENTTMNELLIDQIQAEKKHLSDQLSHLVKLMLVWKHGGIYLDTEVVVLRPLTTMVNFITLQEKALVSSGIFGFGKEHPFLKLCVEDVANNNYTHIDPFHVTKMVHKYCNVNELNYLTDLECDIRVLPAFVGYEITHGENAAFFETSIAKKKKLLARIDQSLFTHTWNNKTSSDKKMKLKKMSCFYEVLMKKHCPVVHADLISNKITFF